ELVPWSGPKAPMLDSQATIGMDRAVSTTSRRMGGIRGRAGRSGFAEAAAGMRCGARRWRHVDPLAGQHRIAMGSGAAAVVDPGRPGLVRLVLLPGPVGDDAQRAGRDQLEEGHAISWGRERAASMERPR